MRCLLLMIGVLWAIAPPDLAGDEKQPSKVLPAYFKVEIQGTLRVRKTEFGRFEPLKLANQLVMANIETSGVSMSLDFGEDKELAALAKTLHGKTVLISGELRRAVEKELSGYPSQLEREPPTAGPPRSIHPRLWFVDYIHVTALKSAE